MNELRDLYQEVIIDHNRKPRNFRKPTGPCQTAHGHNRLCGDKLTIYAELERDAIRELSFQGSGCAISTASASMLTDALRGRSRADVAALFESFQRMLRGESLTADETARLGKLASFAGVGEFPARVKCATLAWHTVLAALDNKEEPVSTE